MSRLFVQSLGRRLSNWISFFQCERSLPSLCTPCVFVYICAWQQSHEYALHIFSVQSFIDCSCGLTPRKKCFQYRCLQCVVFLSEWVCVCVWLHCGCCSGMHANKNLFLCPFSAGCFCFCQMEREVERERMCVCVCVCVWVCVCVFHTWMHSKIWMYRVCVYYLCGRVMNGVHMSWELSTLGASSTVFSKLLLVKEGWKKQAKGRGRRVGEVERLWWNIKGGLEIDEGGEEM